MSEEQILGGEIPVYDKLHAETARVSWAEIERLFAAGKVVEVAAALDLIEVAAAFADDDKDQVRIWMQAEQLGLLADESAARWSALDDAALWAVVVNPWALVQQRL
ncbi:MAG: DUF2288 family protein [Oceanococcus sp.]